MRLPELRIAYCGIRYDAFDCAKNFEVMDVHYRISSICSCGPLKQPYCRGWIFWSKLCTVRLSGIEGGTLSRLSLENFLLPPPKNSTLRHKAHRALCRNVEFFSKKFFFREKIAWQRPLQAVPSLGQGDLGYTQYTVNYYSEYRSVLQSDGVLTVVDLASITRNISTIFGIIWRGSQGPTPAAPSIQYIWKYYKTMHCCVHCEGRRYPFPGWIGNDPDCGH